MKVRIRFNKTGALVYIGHLDVMRYFQKLLRRAGIPVAYSEGFSPHQILSFSHPLPLGMESFGEYADVEITESVKSEEALRSLRGHSVDGIGILSFRLLPEKCENAMASVRASRYTALFPDSCGFDLCTATARFLGKNEINVIKKTKKNEKEINIRSLVHELSVKDSCLEMLISSGSSDNVKPELVIGAIPGFLQSGIDINDIVIKRIDQYTEKDGTFISLDEIGTDI